MIVVIDYGICNVRSVTKAFEEIGEDVIQTADKTKILQADRLVLPGVGAFHEGMTRLRDLGLVDLLHTEVREKGKPFLGICLGAQLAAHKGYEHGESHGLGWTNAEVVPFDARELSIRVPHMGWNDVDFNDVPLFQNLKIPDTFYFVHSYYLEFGSSPPEGKVATCFYGFEFPAAVSDGNIHLVQFHPEKSQKSGLKVIENFCNLD